MRAQPLLATGSREITLSRGVKCGARRLQLRMRLLAASEKSRALPSVMVLQFVLIFPQTCRISLFERRVQYGLSPPLVPRQALKRTTVIRLVIKDRLPKLDSVGFRSTGLQVAMDYKPTPSFPDMWPIKQATFVRRDVATEKTGCCSS